VRGAAERSLHFALAVAFDDSRERTHLATIFADQVFTRLVYATMRAKRLWATTLTETVLGLEAVDSELFALAQRYLVTSEFFERAESLAGLVDYFDRLGEKFPMPLQTGNLSQGDDDGDPFED
jgi:hypothetical protein